MIIVGQTNSVVLRYDIVMYGEYRLGIHSHPGHLVTLQVLHDAGEQSVSTNGHCDIGNGFSKAWHVGICYNIERERCRERKRCRVRKRYRERRGDISQLNDREEVPSTRWTNGKFICLKVYLPHI